MPQGQYSVSDIAVSPSPSGTGQYSVADVADNQSPPSPSSNFISNLTETAKEGIKNIGVGALKGVGSTVVGATTAAAKVADFQQKLATGLAHILGVPVEDVPNAAQNYLSGILAKHPAIQAAINPEGIAQNIGFYGEHALEYLLPGIEAAKVTEGANLAARMLGQGVAAGATAGVQTGGDRSAMESGAAVGAAGPLIGAAGLGVAKKLASVPGLIRAATGAGLVAGGHPFGAFPLATGLATMAEHLAPEEAIEASAADAAAKGAKYAPPPAHSTAELAKGIPAPPPTPEELTRAEFYKSHTWDNTKEQWVNDATGQPGSMVATPTPLSTVDPAIATKTRSEAITTLRALGQSLNDAKASVDAAVKAGAPLGSAEELIDHILNKKIGVAPTSGYLSPEEVTAKATPPAEPTPPPNAEPTPPPPASVVPLPADTGAGATAPVGSALPEDTASTPAPTAYTGRVVTYPGSPELDLAPAKLISEEGVAQHAKNLGIPDDEATVQLTSEGYHIMTPDTLNRALHARTAELGIGAHNELSGIAKDRFGVASMKDLTGEQQMELYEDLLNRKPVGPPIPTKGALNQATRQAQANLTPAKPSTPTPDLVSQLQASLAKVRSQQPLTTPPAPSAPVAPPNPLGLEVGKWYQRTNGKMGQLAGLKPDGTPIFKSDLK